MSGAADRPVAGAAAGHEHGRAPVLLGRAGGGGVAGAADGLPGLLRELIRAVEAVAGVRRVVAAGLALADRGERTAGAAGRAPRRAQADDLVAQAAVGPEARLGARPVGHAAVAVQEALVEVVAHLRAHGWLAGQARVERGRRGGRVRRRR